MPAPRTRAPSTTTGTDALLILLFAVLGAALAFGSLAWLTGNLINTLAGTGAWAPLRVIDALVHPARLWPRMSPAAVLIGARILPGLLTAGLTTTGVVLWWRIRGGAKNGLARKADLAPLLDKQITAKAKSLRPSLSGREGKRSRPRRPRCSRRDAVPGRAEVRASWEDVIVAIMAPRSGKTSGLAIPAILAAPGPVLLTTQQGRQRRLHHHVRRPCGGRHGLDARPAADRPPPARDVVGHPRRRPGPGRGQAAGRALRRRVGGRVQRLRLLVHGRVSNTLGALFLAAARHRRPITDVLAWLASPADRTPVDLLSDAGHDAVAAQLQGTVSGATETRDGIYETARQYASCLLDPEIAAWVTPDRAPARVQARPPSPPRATPCTCSARTAAAPPRRSSRRQPTR